MTRADLHAGRPLVQSFEERLQGLINTMYPDERKRPGYSKLAREISEATGGSISGTYLWELATGKKRNVTLDQLSVLAEFFGVPAEYFLNADVAARVDTQLKAAFALRDARVRSIALRADGLSAQALDALLVMVNEARKIERLSPVDDADDTPAGRQSWTEVARTD
ncbi:hypothetical protein ACIGXM_17890 [Kitasatospora sp. NPDC052896]|uniref:hypothetical protein n=1 Tax=Kitasatospora sp. NPDC052896 TaxID=3364061 RepID=UPI0037CB2539